MSISKLTASSGLLRRQYGDRFKSTRVNSSSTSSTLLKGATDLFVSLRWKAAKTLTESLNETERGQLLRTYQPTPVVLDENKAVSNPTPTPSVSIDEAVAAAVWKEQQRLASVTDEAVARAVEQAEAAAQARVQAELAVIQHRQKSFNAWQNSLDQERGGDTSLAPSKPTNDHELEATDSHPILGACVADLGTKRIYLATAKALASVPVWNQQRIYRHDRAKIMAADKVKTSHLGLLGVIALYEDSSTGKLSIVDGQHRVGMMTILESNYGMTIENVLVEVYTSQSHDDEEGADLNVATIFEEINKAEPVKLVDMPGIMKAKDRNTLNGGVERLYERFPSEMFSTSSRCRAPHVNLDLMRDAIFAANVIEKHQLKSAKALEEWLLDQNERLEKKFTSDATARESVSKQALAKAQKNGFYLGLETTWYQN